MSATPSLVPMLTDKASSQAPGQSRERSAEDMVLALQRQLEQMTAVLERQSKIIDTLIAGAGAARAVALVETAPRAPTVAELWNAYLDCMSGVHWLPAMRSMMARVLAHFAPSACHRFEHGKRSRVLTLGPEMLATDIRLHHWQDFISRLRKTNEVGVTTRRAMTKRMSAFFSWAAASERIPKNTLAGIEAERPRPKRQTRVTEEFLTRLRPHAGRIAWAYILAICDSGLRPGEVRLLKRADIDPETGRTEVHWTIAKSKKSRVAWLTPRVLDAFALLEQQPGNEYVFASPYGTNKPYSKVHLWGLFRSAADAAGLKPAIGDTSVRPHDGRRAHASRLIQLGASLPAVQGILGHANIQTTMGYVDVDEVDLEAAHAKLPTAKRNPPHKA